MTTYTGPTDPALRAHTPTVKGKTQSDWAFREKCAADGEPWPCRAVLLSRLAATEAAPLDMERWIESLHEDHNGVVWTTKAELRQALAAAEAAPLDVERLEALEGIQRAAWAFTTDDYTWDYEREGGDPGPVLRRRLAALRSPDTETTCPGCGKADVPFNDQRGGRHVPSIHRASPDTETAGEAGDGL